MDRVIGKLQVVVRALGGAVALLAGFGFADAAKAGSYGSVPVLSLAGEPG